MRLRPLQGTTQQGPLVYPVLLRSPDDEPANSPRRVFVLAARVTLNPPKRTRGSSKGEPSNAGLSSNSRGVLRPFDASARASQLNPGLPHRVRSAHRVSHPHDGLLLARTSGLVSCRKRPWGFTLQGLSLTTRSYELIAAGLPSWRFSNASTTDKLWNAWRLVLTSLSTCSPNHLSPSGLCSGCESVPWEDFYIRDPSADPLLSFLPLQGITHAKWPRYA